MAIKLAFKKEDLKVAKLSRSEAFVSTSPGKLKI